MAVRRGVGRAFGAFSLSGRRRPPASCLPCASARNSHPARGSFRCAGAGHRPRLRAFDLTCATRTMRRRQLTQGLAAAWAMNARPTFGAQSAAGAPDPLAQKVLRYAFPIAETGFDPAQISDLYSRIVTAHIFDAPLTYDHLARPFKLKPLVAVAMPEVSDDFRTYTFRIQPGIWFADDPAFKGQRRELVAEDFVYALKRIYDPKLKSPGQSILEDEGIIGLQQLHDDTLSAKRPFDYDRPVEGLRALDRYTLRVRLRESRPRHLYAWAARDVYGAAQA